MVRDIMGGFLQALIRGALFAKRESRTVKTILVAQYVCMDTDVLHIRHAPIYRAQTIPARGTNKVPHRRRV